MMMTFDSNRAILGVFPVRRQIALPALACSTVFGLSVEHVLKRREHGAISNG